MRTEYSAINDFIANARRIVVIQADNPDADSLGTALALEAILGDLGKEPLLYCAVDMPTYLRYLPGWDRVQKDLPPTFDASIIVDASTLTLLERLQSDGQLGWLTAKPCLVLDHHAAVENTINFAAVTVNEPTRSSTGELLFAISRQLEWPVSAESGHAMMAAILGDTQGLTNQMASAETYRVMADLLERGVERVELEEKRREFGKMPPEIFRYKAELIKRSEFTATGKLAHVSIPQDEINVYSPLYNPAPLIQNDLLQTQGVQTAIVFKHYDDGRVTAAIRCNNGYPIAAELATVMGGGGHAYASGFKVVGARPFNEIKSECLRHAEDLLTKFEQGTFDETLQHPQPAN